MATFNNGESGLSVRNKLNEIINKVEGVTSINNDVKLGDGSKAIFGAGSDLQIYSDGTNSWIEEHGGGDLYIEATNLTLRALDNTVYATFTDAGPSILNHAGSQKLATTSTGVDVTGTITSDGLTVDKGSEGTYASLSGDNAAGGRGLDFTSSTNVTSVGAKHTVNAKSGAGAIALATASTDRMMIDYNGDVSFYEDTGTTPKMVWKSADERLGIGTDSPGYRLDLGIISNGTTAFNVTNGSNSNLRFKVEDGVSTIMNTGGSGALAFTSGGTTEAMRLTANGDLLVGTTDNSVYNNGTDTSADTGINLTTTYAGFARYNGTPVYINRTGSDGDIVTFNKSGATVGSIGAEGGDLTIGTGDTGLQFGDGGDYIRPWNISTNSNRDNAVDLGVSNTRFKDIYATNGTIQTSDRNEKQDIDVLSDAEQRVAVAAKGLLRKFRWKSAVAEKGDEARIHFGIIAQDLQAAFEAEGLDAGRYAMFIHSTWTDEETGEEKSRMGVRYSELLAFIIAAI